MSLMPENPILPKPQKDVEEILPSIQSKEYCSCLVTSGEVKLGHLLQYIRGTDYIVTYYPQVLGRDDSPTNYDINQTPDYQQYYRVKNFVFRLQGSMDNSFTSDTNQLTLSGRGIMLPGIIPNRGDIFIGDIGNARLGLFSIDSVNPLTYRDGSVFEITFKMIDYLSREIEEDLDEKTVAEYIYDRVALENGQAPIVTEEEYGQKIEIVELYKQLIKRYLGDFYSHEFSTLLVGGQGCNTTYDYYAVKAFLSVVNTRDDSRIRKIELFNVGDYALNEELSFWSMLIEKNPEYLDQVFQKYRVVTTNEFHGHPTTRSIRWTGVKSAVMPLKRQETVDSCFQGRLYSNQPLKMEFYSDPQLSSLGDDRWYVLGSNLYDENITNVTPLVEQYVARLLRGESITYAELLSFHKQVNKLPDVHRYYLQLLLIIMIKLETNRACEC